MPNPVATLIGRGNTYICSECRTMQHNLLENGGVCHFCGASFSNYIETIVNKYSDALESEEWHGLSGLSDRK